MLAADVSLAALDYAVIAIFLFATVAVGLSFARRWRGSTEFFLAGRSLTWPFIGLSLFATNISAEHFVGLASAGHRIGLVQGGYEWIASYCLILLAAVFAPQYLRHKVFTIPEFFEKRYGLEARVGLSLYFLAMIVLTKAAVAIYGGAQVISHFTGWPESSVMWGIGILTAIYTMAGGLSAVIYTDFIQAIVLIGGSVVLTLTALGMVGGWGGLTESLESMGRSDMLSMVRPPTDPELPFTGFLLGNLLIGGLFYWCMDQVNVQRVLGARDVHQARRGAVFAGFLKIIPVFILVLPGVIARVLWSDIPDHDATYAVLIERLLAPGMRGLVLAALFAALMSSLSSTFNSAATIGARDVVDRFWPRASTGRQILVGQFFLVGTMLLGIGIATSGVIHESKDLWTYLQSVTAYLSAPFAAAGLLGILTRRVNRAGALAGVISGVLASAVLFVDQHAEKLGLADLKFITAPLLASFLHRAFLAGALAAVVMTAVSYVTRPPPTRVQEGSFWLFRPAPPEEARPPGGGLLQDDRLWMGVLFVLVTALWWLFR